MNELSSAETAAAQRLIDLALAEDLGDAGDVTSVATIPVDNQGRAAFIARSDGIIAGLPVAALVCKAVDTQLVFTPLCGDGQTLRRGDRLALLAGPMRSVLAAERTALNFLQRLSGIATLTRTYADAITGVATTILDTRKTTPGWRLLEKHAVRCGGGHNHRVGLYDMVLIKDNHLAALGGGLDAVCRAVQAARKTLPELQVEVEVDSLEQCDVALGCGPDIILLDNMKLDQLRACVELRNRKAPAIQLEASGGVNLTTIRGIAETGVDRISVGALTHSATALDIALDFEAGGAL